MVYEHLGKGKANAITGRELSRLLGCGIRKVTFEVERERREGRPICAASGENPGYYLPADDAELEEYCNQLKGRAIELFKTRQALIRVLANIQGTGASRSSRLRPQNRG